MRSVAALLGRIQRSRHETDIAVYAGGSVEHWNEEAGATWMKRLLNTYPKAIWLNPEPEQRWQFTPSIQMLSQIMEERMYPLTVAGLEQGMRELS